MAENKSEIQPAKPEIKDNKIDWLKKHFSIIIISVIFLSLASVGLFLLVTNQRLAQETREGEDAFATNKTVQLRVNTYPCNSEEWHFVMNQISNDAQAPAKITVTFDNGVTEEITLEKVTGGTAHYRPKTNLTAKVVSGSAQVYSSWDGNFQISHGPCNGSSTNPSPSASPTVSPSPSGNANPSSSARPSVSPSGSTQTYTPPDYPVCPAGTQRFTATGDIKNQAGSNAKNHTLNVASAGSISKIVGVKKEGHPEELCKPGTGNDNGKNLCDQNQQNEGFKVLVNGTLVTTINDEGVGKDDQWFGFDASLNPTVPLQAGNNTLRFEHIGGSGIGSVEYKTSFCYSLTTQTSSPTGTPRPTVTSSPAVGGPINTPTPTPLPTSIPTQTPAPTAQPTATPTTVANATPATTNPPTTVANATTTPTNPPVTTAAVESEPDRRAVADAGAEQLPKAGISEQTLAVTAIGVSSLITSFIFHKRRKRFD